jgi:hypothetical protein
MLNVQDELHSEPQFRIDDLSTCLTRPDDGGRRPKDLGSPKIHKDVAPHFRRLMTCFVLASSSLVEPRLCIPTYSISTITSR